MNSIRRRSKKIFIVFTILAMLTSMLPNFGLLTVSKATDGVSTPEVVTYAEEPNEDFSGIILRLNTEKGIWTDTKANFWAISFDILAKDIDLSSFVLPLTFDVDKLFPAYIKTGRGAGLTYANNVKEFTSAMGENIDSSFNANSSTSDTDWDSVDAGKIVLEFMDENGDNINFETETVICTISFIVDSSITEIDQINTAMINIDTDEEKFEIFQSTTNGKAIYYRDVNTYFRLEGMNTTPVPKKLLIKNDPTQGKTYLHGDRINLTGIEFETEYTDGSTQKVDLKDVKIKSGENTDAIADYNNPQLVFEYEGLTATLDLTVIDAVDTIEVCDPNGVLAGQILLGDGIPTDKLILKTTTLLGNKEEITLDDKKITVSDIESKTGIQTITVTYEDDDVTKTTNFDIIVGEAIKDIKISTENSPNSKCIINTKFEKTGSIIVTTTGGNTYEMSMASNDLIKVTESNGNEVNLNKTGKKTLKVTYAGKEIIYDIDVINIVKSLDVDISKIAKYNAVELEYGKELIAEDLIGIEITEKMADDTKGQKVPLGDEDTFKWIDATEYDNTKLGIQYLEINYPCIDAVGNEYIVTGVIPVRVKNELKGIRIENLKTEYVYNEEIDLTDAYIYVEYYSGEIGPLDLSEIEVENNFDNKTIGKQDVTFTYSDEIDTVETVIEFNVEKATLDAPECETLTIMEGEPLSEIELPTTKYGSVVWKDNTQTFENEDAVEVEAVYKMNDEYKDYYNDVNLKVNVNVEHKKITSIELDEKSKLEYFEGQEIEKGDIIIVATYEDGNVARITSGFEIDGVEGKLQLENNEVTTKPITIKYKNAEPIETEIKVFPDEIIGIKLNSENVKTEYKYKEKLDLSNATVEKVMASGIKQEAVAVENNPDVECLGYDATDLAEEQIITIKYAGYETTLSVKVVDDILKAELPEDLKTEYKYGEELEVEYIRVYWASMEDKEDKYIDITLPTEKITIKANTKELGEQTVKVLYKEEEIAKYNITVEDYVVGIKIITLPKNRVYYTGSEIDLTGLVVRDVMASEETLKPQDTTLTADKYIVNEVDTSVKGIKTVTVTKTDGGFTDEFIILVKDPNDKMQIEVNSLPNDYSKFGKDLALEGASVIVKLEDSEEGMVILLIDPGIKISGYNPNLLGRQPITVTYEYEETMDDETIKQELVLTDFPVIVEDYPLELIKLTSIPNKLTYKYGEQLNLDGGKVSRVTASGKLFAEALLTDLDVAVEGFDSTKLGTQTLTVKYLDYATTFNVTVVDNIQKIEMNSYPNKTAYKYGEDLDITGSTIKVIKDSGETVVPVTLAMVTGYNKNKTGEQILTISYEGFTTQFKVRVAAKPVVQATPSNNTGIKNPTGTEIEQPTETEEPIETIIKLVPNKIEIEVGEKLDLSDIVLELLDVEGNKIKEVAITEDMLSEFDSNKVGTQRLTVTYIDEDGIEYTATLSVRVKNQVKTLGEKDENDDTTTKEEFDLIPPIIGLVITGALLALIAILTKKNTDIYELTEEGKELLGKQRITKKDRIILLDNYQLKEGSSIEIVIDSKVIDKVGNEPIKVVLNEKTKEYKVKDSIIIKR